MVSVELSGDANCSANSTYVFQRMLEKGFLVGHNPQRSLVRFLSPLAIEKSEIAHFVTHLQWVFEAMA